METIILPGFSLKNKIWAENIQTGLNSRMPTFVVNWPHWETGTLGLDWIDKEIERIIGLIQNKKVNLLAKSIGTTIAMCVIEKKLESIDKIILCGIPIHDFHSGDENCYEQLKTFPAGRVLCIQNVNDNHGSYAEVRKFLHVINPLINIVSKSRSDHEYPFLEEFENFLQ